MCQQVHQTSQTRSLPSLPNLNQFYRISLQNYMKIAMNQIQCHLRSISQKGGASIQKIGVLPIQKYEKIPDEQILRRGHFFTLIYEMFLFFKQLSNNLNEQIRASLSSQFQFLQFRKWIKDIQMNMKQLTILTRLKKKQNISDQSQLNEFNIKLIDMLYESQIYVFQILLRVLHYQELIEQKIKCQNEFINKNKRQKSIFPQKEVQNLLIRKQKIQMAKKTMTQSQKNKKKELFKQIDKIYTFYHTQISIYRSDCLLKPELLCAVRLLQSKIDHNIFQQVIKMTKLRDLQYLRNHPSIFKQQSNLIQNQVTKIQQADNQITQKDLFQQNKDKQESEMINQRNSQIIAQQNEGKQEEMRSEQTKMSKNMYSSMILKNSEKNKKNDQDIMNKKQSSHFGEQLRQGSLISKYLERSHQKPLKEYSYRQKLQFIGMNNRFNQNKCHLQRRLITPKKQLTPSECSRSQFFSPHLLNKKDQKIVHFEREKVQLDKTQSQNNLMVLANETPKEKKSPVFLNGQLK